MPLQRNRLPVHVSVAISLDVTRQATVAVQVAVAGTPPADELLEVSVADVRLDARAVSAPVRGRQHVLHAPPGRMEIRYQATSPATNEPASPVSTAERIDALRPSRYCPSDRVLGLAGAEFGDQHDDAATMRAVCEYVANHTAYTSGSSGVTTDAVDTLLSGQGVCRDYAHMVAMLGRAAGIPTRLAAVYAPGLSPMDMHAVVEASIEGVWRVFDATRLAPRHSLVRIATGRDAADTAFLSVLDGRADLVHLEVTAVYDGDLPLDDHHGLVSLPL